MLHHSETKKLVFLAVLIFLTYTLGIDTILSSDFLRTWSEFHFVILMNALKLLTGLGALWTLWTYGNRELFHFQFKWTYVGYFLLLLLVHLGWSIFTLVYFPRTMNQTAINSNLAVSDQLTLYAESIGLILISPFVEEFVFRGVIMEALSKWKSYYIDVIVSSALFSFIHIMNHGWVATDFVYYFIPGALLALYFRKTKCIYYVLGYHIFWNALPDIIRLLH